MIPKLRVKWLEKDNEITGTIDKIIAEKNGKVFYIVDKDKKFWNKEDVQEFEIIEKSNLTFFRENNYENY